MNIHFFRGYRSLTVITTSLLVLCSFSCASHAPLQTYTYFHDKTTRQKEMVVFLPGNGGSMNDLKDNGLLDTLMAANPCIDVVGVNATFRYYMDRTLLPRLQKEIVSAARADGYGRIWFMGNSMGGLGSLLYASKHPGEIRGIIFLGPFLGDEPIIKEVSSAGGLLAWTPGETKSDNYQRDLWIYLKRCVTDTTGAYPTLYLLAGNNDRFHLSQQLLAQALPPQNVFWAPGGHDWDAWRISFGAFVRRHVPSIFNLDSAIKAGASR
jgi:pimeloyl-ACP methyl ester carboxylesterase